MNHENDADQESLEARVISGPTPTPIGDVAFEVVCGNRTVTVSVSPLGIGSSEVDVKVWNAACGAVGTQLPSNEEQLEWFRAAARLRKAAGNPPLAGTTRTLDRTVVGAPTRKGGTVVYCTRVRSHAIRVLLFQSGGLMDDCDDWEGVTDEDRDAAITVALDHLFEHPDESRALGLDVPLLEELWR
jgi:hypothetical protein